MRPREKGIEGPFVITVSLGFEWSKKEEYTRFSDVSFRRQRPERQVRGVTPTRESVTRDIESSLGRWSTGDSVTDVDRDPNSPSRCPFRPVSLIHSDGVHPDGSERISGTVTSDGYSSCKTTRVKQTMVLGGPGGSICR